MPSRAFAARHAVTSTTESPKRTTTAPPACLASLPVSKRRVLPPIESSRVVISKQSEVRSLESDVSKSEVGRRSHACPGFDFILLTSYVLLSDSKFLDQIRVSLRVLRFEVVEQAAPLAHQHQQPAP